MKRFSSFLFFLFPAFITHSQDYKPSTKQTDPFSQSFVRLLNAAANGFKDLKGDSLRSTWLMGDDYKLNLDIPGSSIGIVRIRDWDKNVYVEFRGYADMETVSKGFRDLVAKMQQALGDQVETPRFFGNMTSLSIKDPKGFFAPNIEVFAGSSSAEPYLLGPEKEPEDGQPKKYFILLKVHSGIPYYQSYIPDNVPAPDAALHKTIQQMVKEALTDFGEVPLPSAAATKKRKTDTVSMNGYTVYVNKRGQHYSATIPVSQNKLSLATCHQALQAALGSRYVFHESELMERKYNIYFIPNNNELPPVVFLEYPKEKDDSILIRIESRHGHQTKRSADLDE